MTTLDRWAANSKEESRPEKGRQTSRSLIVFKGIVLTTLVVVTLYGLLDRGLYSPERWLPVAGAILGMLSITLFTTGYFADTSRDVRVLVGLLAALVVVKGLSLAWSISPADTVQELFRSSMYLAAFVLAAASLSSRRLVGSFIDGLSLVTGAIAGYGVLQKINPVGYPSSTPDGVRVGSTLEYANTAAVVLGMGIALGLGRMAALGNPVARGLYAALILLFGTVLFFTFSRGGILSLGVGLVVLFILGTRRLQMFANLLLICGPLAWLLVQTRDLGSFFRYVSDEGVRGADGAAFAVYLVYAILAAFVLQAGYAALLKHYEFAFKARLILGVTAILVVLVGAGAVAYSLANLQTGSDKPTGAFAKAESGDLSERLTSFDTNSRIDYWRIAWEEWKEHPLTGTGAGTFQYTWMENRARFGFDGSVKQVHNVYLEQGTETGIVAFAALSGFAAFLIFYAARASWRASGERRMLLSGLAAAALVYLISSGLEWHW